jgi:hypothetical protein
MAQRRHATVQCPAPRKMSGASGGRRSAVKRHHQRLYCDGIPSSAISVDVFARSSWCDRGEPTDSRPPCAAKSSPDTGLLAHGRPDRRFLWIPNPVCHRHLAESPGASGHWAFSMMRLLRPSLKKLTPAGLVRVSTVPRRLTLSESWFAQIDSYRSISCVSYNQRRHSFSDWDKRDEICSGRGGEIPRRLGRQL